MTELEQIHDLASQLAEHRKECMDVQSLEDYYYGNTFDDLSTYSLEELQQMISEEIN